MDISSDKLAKSHTRTVHGYKRETFRVKLNLFEYKRKKITITTNYIEAKIDNAQQNNKYGLYDDKDKTIDHTTSECSKLAYTDFKTRNDWKLCKNLKFDHVICIYRMVKFQFQTRIRLRKWGFWNTNGSANSSKKTWSIAYQQNKENLPYSRSCRRSGPLSERKKIEIRDKYLDLT